MGQYYKAIFLVNPDKLGVAEALERNVRGEDASHEIIGWLDSWDYDNGCKLMEHSWIGNAFMRAAEASLAPTGKFHKSRVVWGGDYAEEEAEGENLYHYAYEAENLKQTPTPADKNQYRYVINHSKKLYVDMTTVPVADTWTDPDTKVVYEYRIHPLSLLTAEGNGQGGGDFRGDDELVGSWARDIISVDNEIPEDFTLIDFNLKEN